MKETIKGNESKIEDLNEKTTELASKVEEKEIELERMAKSNSKKEEAIKKLNTEKGVMERRLRAKKKEINESLEKIGALNSELDESKNTVASSEEYVLFHQERVRTIKDSMNIVVISLQKQLSELEIVNNEYASMLEKLRSENSLLRGQVAEMTTSVEGNTTFIK